MGMGMVMGMEVLESVGHGPNRGECGVSPRPAYKNPESNTLVERERERDGDLLSPYSVTSRAVSSATCGSKPSPLPDNCLQPVMSAPHVKNVPPFIFFLFPLPAKHALYNLPFLPLSLWLSRENMSVFSLSISLSLSFFNRWALEFGQGGDRPLNKAR